MPLNVDKISTGSLSVNGNEITGNGGSSDFIIGKINVNPPYVTIDSTEQIIETFLLTKNTLTGFKFPGFDFTLDSDTSTYNDLIIKLYVNEINSIDGLTPLYQETFNNEYSPNGGGQLLQAYYSSGFPSNVNSLEFNTNTVKVLYYDNVAYRYYSESFENFDVSKDQYIIVTAEKIGSTLNVRPLSLTVIPFK